jgi:hypothetical protein
VEQLSIAPLLFNRRAAPEPPEAESRHTIDIDCSINDHRQFRPLFAIGLRAVHDSHKPVANALDERAGGSVG